MLDEIESSDDEFELEALMHNKEFSFRINNNIKKKILYVNFIE